jgi:hypothetical protein
MRFAHRLWTDDAGQGLGEYLLIMALVCAGLVLMVLALTLDPGEVAQETGSVLSDLSLD